MSKGLRVIAEPKVVAQPMGVRIRTRLRTSQEDLDVLLQIGEHLGSLARKDLAARVRLGNTREDGRATRKQALTADSSSRWAGAITRTSNDQWNLSWRALNEHRTSTRRAIAVIEKRLEIPVGERVGKTRGYENREERFGKQQRLQVLKARLRNLDARVQSGKVSVVLGGRGLLKNRHNLEEAGLTEQQWRRQWRAARLFLTADGESGRNLGNETLRVDPTRAVLSVRLPSPLTKLANAKHGRYEIPLVSLFSQHTDEWKARVLSSRAVRYDISYDPVKNRVYLDASWKRTDVPDTPSLETAVARGVLAVDTNDGHLACRVLDSAGNPVGHAHTVRLDLEGLPASQRDGRLRGAISTLIRIAKDAGASAIAIEDLNFADARATGRETMGRGARGRRFRKTVAGIPTGKLRDRLGAMVPRAGLTLVAIDPAHTSRWGKQHWLKPHEKDGAVDHQVNGTADRNHKTSGHHAAALVIGRRALGYSARRRKGVTARDRRIVAQRATNQANPNPGAQDVTSRGGGRRAPATRLGNTRPAAPSQVTSRRSKTVRGAGVSQNDTF